MSNYVKTKTTKTMEPNAKQQVSEKLRNCNSVLITVSDNPTVDQLAAALGLTLMMNALNKHTTAVFSGKVPNTMEFLEPGKTFENTVEGLRDFIISLDKDKADKLRYKVEDDVVKIFITPYRDAITDKDLRYSQGDYNVDLVMALGVHNRDQLDNAITSHGRILHDATIVTINAGEGASDGNLGSINWGDTDASCLCEMLVSISEALQGGIIDKQMSTAFLTGIVAATERFKNDNTTPKIMTMAAQLMAAGANQQLIATNLQIDAAPAKEEAQPEKPKDESELTIDKSDDSKVESKESDTSDDQSDSNQEDKKDDWQLGVSDKEDKKELGSMNEESLDPELLAKIKEINRIHAASALAPSTKGRRKSSKKKKQLKEDDPIAEDDSINATSAEVERRNNRQLSHDRKVVQPPPKKKPPVMPVEDPQESVVAPRPESVIEPPKPSAPPSRPTQPAKKDVVAPDPFQQPDIPAAPEVKAEANTPSADVDTLEKELDKAREAVENAVTHQFNPDNNPTSAINAQPMSDNGDMHADLQGNPAPIVDTPPAAAPPAPIADDPSQTLAIPGAEAASSSPFADGLPVDTPPPMPPQPATQPANASPPPLTPPPSTGSVPPPPPPPSVPPPPPPPAA